MQSVLSASSFIKADWPCIQSTQTATDSHAWNTNQFISSIPWTKLRFCRSLAYIDCLYHLALFWSDSCLYTGSTEVEEGSPDLESAFDFFEEGDEGCGLAAKLWYFSMLCNRFWANLVHSEFSERPNFHARSSALYNISGYCFFDDVEWSRGIQIW